MGDIRYQRKFSLQIRYKCKEIARELHASSFRSTSVDTCVADVPHCDRRFVISREVLLNAAGTNGKK